VPGPWAFLGVWIVGGGLALAGALSYAELAALRPRAGGEYVYLGEGLGPLAAFLSGWTSFVAGFAGAIAAGALGAADYLGRFIPAASSTAAFANLSAGPLHLIISPRTIVAVTIVAALALLHVRGLGPGRLVQNSLAALKVAALAAFVAIGLSFGHGDWSHVTSAPAAGTWNLPLAFIIVMFSYSGWNAASYVAEEVRDPGRNVPRALAIGTAAVVILYLGLNLLYLYAVPLTEMGGGTQELAMTAADRLLGPTAARLLGALAVFVLLGSLSAMTIAGPRVYFAMARDRLFVRAAGRVHPRFQTPHIAILAQAVWSALLIVTDAKDQLAEYTGFAVLLFSGLAVSTVFILRHRRPDDVRPFRAWGYPVAPAVFVAASLAITGAAVLGRPGPSLYGLGVIALGLPVYWWFRRQSN
jgi:APA family basic amino acid/polyamine antiporter